jgi:hypothetical protein
MGSLAAAPWPGSGRRRGASNTDAFEADASRRPEMMRFPFNKEQSPAGARSNLRCCRPCVLGKKARLGFGV